MVKVIKSTIVRRPEDLVKLKYSTGIILGRNIRPIKNRKALKDVKIKNSLTPNSMTTCKETNNAN